MGKDLNASMPIQKIFTIEEAYNQEIAYIEARKKGEIKSINTGFSKWNSVYLNGYEWGYICTIAGMSGCGKTTFLNQMLNNIRELNPNEIFHELNFNYEMSSRRLVGKTLSSKLKKSVRDIYSSSNTGNDITDEEIEIIKRNKHKIIEHDINYVEYPGSVHEMSNTIDYFASQRNIGGMNQEALICTLDHPLIVKRGGVDEREMLTDLMCMFNIKKKLYPKSLWIIISQLNRNIHEPIRRQRHGEQRILNYPEKSDVFGGESLYQFSDSFVIIHRPEMLHLYEYGLHDWSTRNMMFAHHLKTRDGDPMITTFKNELKTSRFLELNI